MTPNIPDHYLWLGLGTFALLTLPLISHGLHTILHLTAIHNPPPPTPPPQTLPSNATHQTSSIHPSSLLTLATSHNTELRSSATRILATRFYAHRGARRALLRDLKSADEGVARKARLALGLLREVGVWKESGGVRQGGWRVVGRVGREGADRSLGVGERESEMEMRRRRREAVVIHDGDGTLEVEEFWGVTPGAPAVDTQASDREAEEFEDFITELGIGARE